MYCSPIPENIARCYVDVVDHEYLRHSSSRILSGKAVLADIARYESSGTLLDVGCATGDFLIAAKDCGYQAEGIELSKWSSQVARDRGLTVYQEPLELLAARSAGKYDIITLWGVIEHFARPDLEMNHIRGLLKPGGILAMWTGDIDSVTSRLLGRKWWYWQGQHIQYFSHRSLKCLIERSGLSHITTTRYPFVMTYETLSNSLRRYGSRSAMLRILAPLFAIKATWSLRLPGEMLFLARRPECE